MAAGGDFARPGPPSKIQILPKRPTPPRSSPSLVRRCREPQKQLTTQPAVRALRGNVWWKGGLRRCARNDGGAAPGFLCRILGSRRALRQARTKSELLLARLRRSWHIRLQWNSCGCRRRLRPARPTLKNPDPSKAAHALPALHRASSRDAASRRKQLTTQPVAPALRGNVWWKGGLRRCARNDGGAAPPGFLCRILGSRRALRQARTKSELLLARLRRSWHIRLQWNSCGCRRRLRPARPRPLKIQFLPKRPTPSPALHRACRATSTFALFLPRLLLFATF